MTCSVGRRLLFASILGLTLLGQAPANTTAAADIVDSKARATGLFGVNIPDQLTRLRTLDPYCFTPLTPDWFDAADGSFNSVVLLVEKDGESVCPNIGTPYADHYVDVQIIPVAPDGISLARIVRSSGSAGLLTYVLVSVVERIVPIDDHKVSKQTLLVRRGLVPVGIKDDDHALRMARRWVAAMGDTVLPYVPDQLDQLRKLNPLCFAFVVESHTDPGNERGTRIATVAVQDGKRACPTNKKPDDLTKVDVKFMALRPFGINLVRVDQYFGMLANPPEYVLVSLVEAVVPIKDDVSEYQVLLVRRASLPSGIDDDDQAQEMAERWAAAMSKRR